LKNRVCIDPLIMSKWTAHRIHFSERPVDSGGCDWRGDSAKLQQNGSIQPFGRHPSCSGHQGGALHRKAVRPKGAEGGRWQRLWRGSPKIWRLIAQPTLPLVERAICDMQQIAVHPPGQCSLTRILFRWTRTILRHSMDRS
jgi:hypothetical protein